ncbi:MAG: hypothetical protein ACTTHG_00635 [Treponemataceae bacterium]
MKKLVLPMLSVILFLLTACPNQILPPPKQTDLDSGGLSHNSTIIWGAPQNLTASQGLKGRVVLSWEPIKSAAYYYIYEADDAYSNFTFCGQVDSTTNWFSVICPAGTDKWYQVRAKKANGTLSSPSDKVRGTSLAQPNINKIEEGEINSSQSTVYWYMNNVDEDTYPSSVHYIVCCTDSTGTQREIICKGVDSSKNIIPTQVTFKNLNPNTEYHYQVFAYNINYQNEMEISEKVTAETAHKSTPNAPEDLRATQGETKSGITLTFKLPEKTDIKQSDDTYKQYPSYFKIFRKQLNSTSPYEAIGEYKVSTNPDFSDYIPGTQVSWKDETSNPPNRGIQYSYKVQSFVQHEKRIISSDESFSTVCAWMPGQADFSIKSIVNVTNNNKEVDPNDTTQKYVRTNISFNVSFETFKKDDLYKYVLTEKRHKLEKDNGNVKDEVGCDEKFYEYNSLDEIKNIEYELPYGQFSGTVYTEDPRTLECRGYYRYNFFVIPSSFEFSAASNASAKMNELNTACFSKTNILSDVLITDDTEKPELKDFEVVSGYKDKIIIRWTYDPTIVYSIYCTTDEQSEFLPEELINKAIKNKSAGDTVELEHQVESGFRAKYTLRGYRGIYVEKTFSDSSGNEWCQTLGTAKPKFNIKKLDYSKVTIQWAPVQMATKYRITYAYDDINKHDLGTVTLQDMQPYLNDGVYNYTFETLERFYNNPLLSGKNIVVSVKAINETDPDPTEGTTSAFTMGPANTNVEAAVSINDSEICVYWNIIEGVEGYIVRRDRYAIYDFDITDNNKYKKLPDWTAKSSIFYYVTKDGSVSGLNEKINKSKVQVSKSNNRFTLKDIALDKKDNEGTWYKDQDMIFWGVPYNYIVFPVKSSEDFDSGTFENEKVSLSSGKIEYKSSDLALLYKDDYGNCKNRGSTRGFGFNVTATKSTYNNQICVNWEKPYSTGGEAPKIYRRRFGAAQYRKIKTCASSDTTFTDKITGSDKINSYEYAVVYSLDLEPKEAYIEELSKIKTSDTNSEPINKGYQFAMNIEKEPLSNYREAIRFTKWDYSQRAVGPKNSSSYKIQIKNPNIDSAYHTIAEFKVDDNSYVTGTTYANDNNITINSQTCAVEIRPKFNSDNIDTGVLQVLRDYKHYVKFVALNENDVPVMYDDDEENCYTYREITDKEFCRCVSLIIADALFQTGIPNKDVRGEADTKELFGANGVFSISAKATTFVWGPSYYINSVAWGFANSNYNHTFKSGTCSTNSKIFKSAFSLESGTSIRLNGESKNTLYYLPALSINVKHETGLPCYEGNLNFEAGKSGDSTVFDLKMSKNGNTLISVDNNEDDFLKWFPYDIGTKHATPETNVNAALPIYQNPWWK